MMQVREQYELRRKKSQEIAKQKLLRSPSRKDLRKLLKQLLKVTNQQPRVLGRKKKKTTKTLRNKVNQ